MTVALELVAALKRAGASAAFVATGQTGIAIAGDGIAVDAVVADFIAGAAERMVCDAAEVAEWVVVEGQGSLTHPGFSGVTLGLLHGSAPDPRRAPGGAVRDLARGPDGEARRARRAARGRSGRVRRRLAGSVLRRDVRVDRGGRARRVRRASRGPARSRHAARSPRRAFS